MCPSGFKRHPNDCNLFYQCTAQSATMNLDITVFKCPAGHVYNDRKCQCSPPDAADRCAAGAAADQTQSRSLHGFDDDYDGIADRRRARLVSVRTQLPLGADNND